MKGDKMYNTPKQDRLGIKNFSDVERKFRAEKQAERKNAENASAVSLSGWSFDNNSLCMVKGVKGTYEIKTGDTTETYEDHYLFYVLNEEGIICYISPSERDFSNYVFKDSLLGLSRITKLN